MGTNVGSLRYFWIILGMLAAGGALSAFGQVAHTMQIVAGRPDIALKFNVVSAFIYPPLLWLSVKNMGLQGAAATWLAFNILYVFPLFVATATVLPGITAFQSIWRYLLIPTTISVLAFSLARPLQEFSSLIVWPSFILTGALAAVMIAALDPTIRNDLELGLAILTRDRGRAP